MRGMRTRTLLICGLAVALLVGGVASLYASSSPDGLEYVAEEVGYLDTAEDSATAGSPLADYQTEGVENDRLSVAIPGVIGTLVVLVLAGGLAFAVRRRGGEQSHDEAAADADSSA